MLQSNTSKLHKDIKTGWGKAGLFRQFKNMFKIPQTKILTLEPWQQHTVLVWSQQGRSHFYFSPQLMISKGGPTPYPGLDWSLYARSTDIRHQGPF